MIISNRFKPTQHVWSLASKYCNGKNVFEFHSLNIQIYDVFKKRMPSCCQVQGKIMKLCWSTKHNLTLTERRTKKCMKRFYNCTKLAFCTCICISCSSAIIQNLLQWSESLLSNTSQHLGESRSSSLILFALLCHLDKWW
jgi:hypothetical protein